MILSVRGLVFTDYTNSGDGTVSSFSCSFEMDNL